MYNKLSQINKRFVKQSIVLLIFVIVISSAGVFITGSSSIRSTNKWGTKTAESLILKQKLFFDHYESIVEQCSYYISDMVNYGVSVDKINEGIKEYSDIFLKEYSEHEYGVYLYTQGKVIWGGDYVEHELGDNYNVEDRAWYNSAKEGNGEIVFTDVYKDYITGKKKISIAKLLDDKDSILVLDIFTDDIKFIGNVYTEKFIGSQTVVDKYGNIVYHSPLGKVEDTNCIFKDYTPDDFKKLVSNFEGYRGSVKMEIEGKKAICYYFIDENGWTSFISIDYDVIVASTKKLFIFVLILILGLILSIGYLFYLNYKGEKKWVKTIGYFEKLINTYYSVAVVDINKGKCRFIKRFNSMSDTDNTYKNYDEFKADVMSRISSEYKEEFDNKFTLDNFKNFFYQNDEKFYIEYKRLFDVGAKWVSAEVFKVDDSFDDDSKEVIVAFREINSTKVLEIEKNELLKNSLKIAEDAVKVRSDFLSRMSHDMRTPMNAIIGFTNIAENNIKNEFRVKDCLTKITSSTNHLLSLVNEILDMAKIEQGKLELKYSEVNLYNHISEVADIFKVQCEISNKKFISDINICKHSIAYTDVMRIDQILNNILSNAIKYTTVGDSIKFEVKEFPISKNNSIYKFVISDTGIGMSPEFMKKLFTPFEREEIDIKKEVNGVGLGMAIVKSTVQLLGGQIDVSSEVGKGSVFTVSIPVKILDRIDVNGKYGDNSSVITDFSGKRFLVVEDNPLNMEIAKEIFEIEGIEVVSAYNGKEAYEIFKSNEDYYFDAVIMDIQMPVMNGYESAKMIRDIGSEYSENVPIIAMTADAFADDVTKSSVAGMNGHISKPVDYKRLKEILSKYIK